MQETQVQYLGQGCWRKERQPTPESLSGESYGQRSPVGDRPWGHEESDTTERPPVAFALMSDAQLHAESCVPGTTRQEVWVLPFPPDPRTPPCAPHPGPAPAELACDLGKSPCPSEHRFLFHTGMAASLLLLGPGFFGRTFCTFPISCSRFQRAVESSDVGRGAGSIGSHQPLKSCPMPLP